MNDPAFILENNNLTLDPSHPHLCTNEPHVCYGVKVPVPVTVSGGGGSTSISGGPRGWLVQDPTFGKVLHIQERIEVAPWVKMIYGKDKDVEKKITCPPIRKSVPKTKQEIYDLKLCVKNLKERSKELELERDSALAGSVQIHSKVEQLRAELATAVGKITALQLDLARLEGELDLERQGFSLQAALPWFTASAMLGLAAALLAPGDLPLLRWAGYSGAVVLAAIGIGSAFGGPEPTAVTAAEPLKQTQPLGLLPIGVVRLNF
jgi:hypothetical protein